MSSKTPQTKHPDEMNETELAHFYEANRGNTDLWQSKPRKIRVRRGGPSTIFTLRLAPEELEQLYKVAAKQGETLSDFIRKGALDRAANIEKKAKRTSKTA
jgi:hypothetical protein